MKPLIVAALLFSTGCSTGIESTKKIHLTKGEIKASAPTEEQKFASTLKGKSMGTWEPGKEFISSSERTILIFEPSALPYSAESNNPDTSIEGVILRYIGTEERQTPNLGNECVILFTDGTNTYRYPTGKEASKAIKEVYSSKIPLLYDMDLVAEWREKLKDKKLWTRSNLWYDADGQRRDGLKYSGVTVEDVEASTGSFPMKVKIRHPELGEAYLHMNYTDDKADSRNFAAIFLLKDPKEKYPHISKENWQRIQEGKIALGMTKEECRLSLGSPDDLDSGHDTTQTLDIWKYGDGIYLIFTDGLLTRYRQ